MFRFIARIRFERRCIDELVQIGSIPHPVAVEFVLSYRDQIEEMRAKRFNHINALAVACLYVLEHRNQLEKSGNGFQGTQEVLVAWTYGLAHTKHYPMHALSEEFVHHILTMKEELDADPDMKALAGMG